MVVTRSKALILSAIVAVGALVAVPAVLTTNDPPQALGAQLATCGRVTRTASFVPSNGAVSINVPVDREVRAIRIAVCTSDAQTVQRISGNISGTTPLSDHDVYTTTAWQRWDVPIGGADRLQSRLSVRVHAADLGQSAGERGGTYVSVSPIRAASAEHPNIVFVSIDTLRRDRLSTYGYSLPTSPSLTKLAQQGAIFTTAISQAPSTPPSHGAMLSGLYPAKTGLFVTRDVSSRGDVAGYSLRADIPTLQERLQAAGYYTAAMTGGGFVSRLFGFARGFDAFTEETSTLPGEAMRTGANVIDWLDENLDNRFFLFLHTYEVHAGQYGYQHEYFHLQSERDAFYAAHRGTPDAPLRNARYDSGVQFVDAVLGQIFYFLEARQALANTLVVVTSDHGETMDEREEQAGYAFNHGFALYDELVHVPLVIAGPHVPPGMRIDRQVEIVDVMPTVLELAGADAGLPPLDGESLVPLLRGRSGYGKNAAYSESVAGGPYRSAVRLDGYKYVRVLNWGLTSAQLMKLPPPEELYDLRLDPGERVNLANRPDMADVLRRMRAALDSAIARAGTMSAINAQGTQAITER